jgi:hypothetical protein
MKLFVGKGPIANNFFNREKVWALFLDAALRSLYSSSEAKPT